MKHFKRLTPEDYRRYVINPPADFSGQITWYGHPVDMEYQDIWLVLAFLQPAAHPGILSFHLCHVDGEGLFFQEEDYETFDILSTPTLGYWTFTQEEFAEFIAILWEHGRQLAASSPQDQLMFRRIDPQDLPRWNIRDEPFTSTAAYFYQAYDPLRDQDPRNFTTMIFFARSLRAGTTRLTLILDYFPRSALRDPNYNPRDKGLGCINLDRKGVEEFIRLLEELAFPEIGKRDDIYRGA